ncbi:MAG: methylated-DNA--[protein]-cysteine S-methyltransferase [Acholeplasmataceae bacterium]|nr:methylated-DNA--[protein]-cysteine S-methyltransferase [Acholeplasmataceae bacterium]
MVGKYTSPLGTITFFVEGEKLCDMTIDDLNLSIDHHPMLDEISNQLDLYFKGQLKKFSIPIDLKGTPFQCSVWQSMMEIPFGETKSYQEIAQRIGKPKAVRAVGQACKRNPIGIIVPCHRVIGKDGSLTGYSGPNHVGLKQKLLMHEQNRDFKRIKQVT